MIAETLAIGGLGMLAALGLGVAAKVFYVEVDPLVEAIEGALPGANCGGCGEAGCSSAAAKMAKGLLPPNACVGGGPDVGQAVAVLLGVTVSAREPELAKVGCRYPSARADLKFRYSGVESCRSAVMFFGGPKECPVGCIGLGSCVAACPFDAVHLGADGLPVVDETRCTGCGTCVRTCPVGIMNLTSVTNRILGEFTTGDCTAPCQRTCPAGINVPEQIRQTALGNYDQALLVIKERNPLPLICGRICPHPCEQACRRNLADEPVAINPLKRFVADRERAGGQRLQPYKAPSTGRKVAVVGGGVEGLTASYFMARLGHEPAVFEALPQLGGLLRTVIPESRLPREVLDWEIQGILDMGVTAQTGLAFGKDINLTNLFGQGYEAVLVATGGWDSLLLRGGLPAPAPALDGLYLMLPLSLAWARGQKPPIGKSVVIIGGGKQALATARQCLKQGAARVTVLFRRQENQLGIPKEDMDAARIEGINIYDATRVTRLTGRGDRLTGLSFAEIWPNEHESGELKLEADTVIAASGRLPEMIFTLTGEQDELPVWQTVMPYRAPNELLPGLFDAAEPVSDFRAAVEAIGAGRRAAASIHRYLTGQEVTAPANMLTTTSRLIDVDSLVDLREAPPRQQMTEATPEERLNPRAEIEKGLSEEQAKTEAKRCLNCGLICYYRTQYDGFLLAANGDRRAA